MRVRSKPPMPTLQRSELEAITRTAGLPMAAVRTDAGWASTVQAGRWDEVLFASADERAFRELWRQAEATRAVVTK